MAKLAILMGHSSINPYDADVHVAEVYDQSEIALEDVNLLRRLIANFGSLNILEPFCGTGRLLLPLALDGHTVLGMDQAAGMLKRLHRRIQALPPETRERISFVQADVLSEEWPRGFDLVILGGNCFYELATPDEQEKCIVQASRSLNPGGHLFVDNDHMEGDLAASWQRLGVVEPGLAGKCSDGTLVETTRATIWFDAGQRLARFRRRAKVTLPDGNVIEQEYIQQKHPVSRGEVQGWLEKDGFMIERIYGDRSGAAYNDASPRAIFWARRK
jgi:SAM-dependent methyltransferase